MNTPDFDKLADIFRTDNTRALVLMGSHARGDACAYSDIDLMRIVHSKADDSDAGTHLIDGDYVVVSDYIYSDIESWFTEPETATTIMFGLKEAKQLWDPEGMFDAVRTRASEFRWTDELQLKANETDSVLVDEIVRRIQR